jgi:F-type H+-transporting ATPase subunit delta
MAELSTIARPYAEGLFKSVGSEAGVSAAFQIQLQALADVAAHPDVRQFAQNPKVQSEQMVEVLGAAISVPLYGKVKRLLSTLVENNRLSCLPEVARQFQQLIHIQSGIAEALIESAFPIDDAELRDVVAALEKRFARKLHATVMVKPELIGGIRVAMGDQVLDTSVAARLQHMKAVLMAA